MKRTLPMMIALMLMTLIIPVMPALAGEMGGNDGMRMPYGMKSGMKGLFLSKKEVDGYTVSFHVMKAKTSQALGGDHDFMVKIEKGGQAADVVAVNSRIKYPAGQEESKMMMKMGDWYMIRYDMPQRGRYQLMVLFKTADGAVHFCDVYYSRR